MCRADRGRVSSRRGVEFRRQTPRLRRRSGGHVVSPEGTADGSAAAARMRVVPHPERHRRRVVSGVRGAARREKPRQRLRLARSPAAPRHDPRPLRQQHLPGRGGDRPGLRGGSRRGRERLLRAPRPPVEGRPGAHRRAAARRRGEAVAGRDAAGHHHRHRAGARRSSTRLPPSPCSSSTSYWSAGSGRVPIQSAGPRWEYPHYPVSDISLESGITDW